MKAQHISFQLIKHSHLGRGIFAGRSYQAGDFFTDSPSVLLSAEHSLETQMQYYCYGMRIHDEPDRRNHKSINESVIDGAHYNIYVNSLEKLPISQFVFGVALLTNHGPRHALSIESG